MKNFTLTVVLILSTLFLIAQNLDQSDIRNQGISKITSYYKSLGLGSSTVLNMDIIDSSTIRSITTFDIYGRILKSTLFYSDSISTHETFNYEDSIYVCLSKNLINNCKLRTTIFFKSDKRYYRKVNTDCMGNISYSSGSLITMRFLSTDVLYDMNEDQNFIYYTYDSKSKMIDLWSINNHMQIRGQNFILYNKEFELLKRISYSKSGDIFDYDDFCSSIALRSEEIEVDTISYKNYNNLEIQKFTKLVLQGVNRSSVYSYQYEYRNK